MSENEYRFNVSEHDGTITRGRLYRLPSDWTSDSWSHYWDNDTMVAFIDEYHHGLRAVSDNEDTERAMRAHRAEKNTETGSAGGLDRLAYRLTGQSNARFICVGLDRGSDLYALAWGGDPDGEWRNEIEALNWGDIYRIECEEYQPGFGVGGGDWVPSEEYPEEFYGDDVAAAEFARIFDLPEFPAEMFVGGE